MIERQDGCAHQPVAQIRMGGGHPGGQPPLLTHGLAGR
jgi:hypothetical protein